MIYKLDTDFSKIEQSDGMMQNMSHQAYVEVVSCIDDPHKDNGIILLPLEKMNFKAKRGESVFARSAHIGGTPANLAVVNFNVPASSSFGAGVGSIIYSHALLDGYVKANGDLLKRDEYPELYEFTNKNKLLVSDTDWHKNMRGMYSVGDDITTFRVPDLRSEFLRGLDDGRGVDADRTLGSNQNGSYVRWAIGIVGQGAQVAHTFDGEEAFLFTSKDAQRNTDGLTTETFNNCRVRPRNIALIAQIKY